MPNIRLKAFSDDGNYNHCRFGRRRTTAFQKRIPPKNELIATSNHQFILSFEFHNVLK